METTATVKIAVLAVLVLKHTPQHNESAAESRRIRSEINLQHVPGDQEDDPLLFWKRRLFPSLEEAAKNCLTRSASSVPAEYLFSTMGLLLNGKRLTLAPHRANWLSFIHNNYATYFDVDVWIWIGLIRKLVMYRRPKLTDVDTVTTTLDQISL